MFARGELSAKLAAHSRCSRRYRSEGVSSFSRDVPQRPVRPYLRIFCGRTKLLTTMRLWSRSANGIFFSLTPGFYRNCTIQEFKIPARSIV